jgi:GT2 family glycosyltransferase
MNIYVIIVTYNPKQWIDKCFSSLRKSEIQIKTIVIDNGSIDGSQEIIKQRFQEVEFYQAKNNYGFGLANNLGIKIAYDRNADYVFLLNQDAWIEPNTIGLLVNKMQEDHSYGVLSPIHLNGNGDAMDLDFSNCLPPLSCPKLFSDIYLNKNLDKIYESLFVNAAAWLMSRKCIEKVGGFSPSFFHYGEDLNYVHRMHFYNVKLGVYPLTHVYHDREQRAISKYFSDYGIAMQRNFICYYSNPEIDTSFFRGQVELFKYILIPILKGNHKDAWKIIKKWPLLIREMRLLKITRKISMNGEKQCFLPLFVDKYLL